MNSRQVAATTPSEDEQRYRDWMDGCWRAVREENDAKILQLQDCSGMLLSLHS